MAEYIRQIDDIITNPAPLPESFKTDEGIWITGFHYLSDAEVLKYGFIKLLDNTIDYDPETQDIVCIGYNISKDGKTATRKYEIVPKG